MNATTTEGAAAASAAIDWDEERWAAAKPLLGHLVEHVPDDLDPIEDRLRMVAFAAQRAESLARQWPTDPPGANARAFLDAMRLVSQREPRPSPDPKSAPQTVRAAARLAADLAQDPAAADRIDSAFQAGIDMALGGPGRPVAQYHAEVDAARQRLAEACEERLSRIPVEWRREAGAPTRAERAVLNQAREELGMDL